MTKTVRERNLSTSDQVTTVLSYGALLLLGYLVFKITSPFLVPLAWSAVLAIFFYPLYEKLLKKFRPTPAAAVSAVAVTLLLIVPAIVVLFLATKEAIDAGAKAQVVLQAPDKALPTQVLDWLKDQLPESMQDADLSDPVKRGAERLAGYLAAKLGGLLRNLFAFFLDLFVLVFALFFMFRDGEEVVRGVRHLMPFDASIQEDMMRESRDLIFASVAVGLLIAAVQGALGGLAFSLAGVGTALFWAVLIAFFSLVPVVGSALIWVPTALWLAFTGHIGKGLIVAVICGGVAGVADNIIRPLLLRNRTHLNELLLFISVLGGIEVFGLLGLVAGPTIVAAAMGVFRVYMDHRDKVEVSQA
ncbi:MAG TPA: AI-2E family transporter [Candidatus Acidoferrum sp.]|nr:AI-2E family transporter [Candidatus Acidoferrum sp.]